MAQASALILFAHGARDPAWAHPLRELAAALQARAPALVVRTAFLEMQAPSLPEAIDALAPLHRHIAVLPVFWAAAGHVRESLPALLTAARGRHPGLELTPLPVLSDLPGLLDHVAGAALSLVHRPLE